MLQGFTFDDVLGLQVFETLHKMFALSLLILAQVALVLAAPVLEARQSISL